MSLALVHSRALDGLAAPSVTVEVHLANGLPSLSLVGLPDAEVREARDRVRAALTTAGFEFPARRITVNLAPADLPKESGRYDLPIALGILAASGQLPTAALEGHEFVGELSLTGALRPVRGALAMCIGARRAGRRFVVPLAVAGEAARVDGAEVLAAEHLLDVCAHLGGRQALPRQVPDDTVAAPAGGPDLADVRGQVQAKRALEIAAAGGHSLLMSGPPGTGKSMLATRLPGLLPPLTPAAALDAAAVQSLAGIFDAARWGAVPYRAPHHTASAAALVGGGANPSPGEISLAHHGVLFLDELPEFDRRVLEVLREPMESGRVLISRAARRVEYPAAFQLVAAMNPCPCGLRGHASGRCRCTPDQVARYRGKLSGPLLDRIDLHLDVPALSGDELQQAAPGETSATVRSRVAAARDRALARQQCVNAALTAGPLEQAAQLDAEAQALLTRAVDHLHLSARAYQRIRKVARTIADLAGEAAIQRAHVAEAMQYRPSAASP